MNTPQQSKEVFILDNHSKLTGDLSIPSNATKLVLFAHGSGSSRHSVRNQYVAQVLNKNNIATLLFDLLTLDEEAMQKMQCIKKLDIVPGATHLFEEPGTLEEVAKLASHWFLRYL